MLRRCHDKNSIVLTNHQHLKSNTAKGIKQIMSTATGNDTRENDAETKGGNVFDVESAITAETDAETKGECASNANSAKTSPAIETVEKEDALSAKSTSPSSAPTASTDVRTMSLNNNAMADTNTESMTKANSTADSETSTNQKGECHNGNNVMHTKQNIATNGRNKTLTLNLPSPQP